MVTPTDCRTEHCVQLQHTKWSGSELLCDWLNKKSRQETDQNVLKCGFSQLPFTKRDSHFWGKIIPSYTLTWNILHLSFIFCALKHPLCVPRRLSAKLSYSLGSWWRKYFPFQRDGDPLHPWPRAKLIKFHFNHWPAKLSTISRSFREKTWRTRVRTDDRSVEDRLTDNMVLCVICGKQTLWFKKGILTENVTTMIDMTWTEQKLLI